jgi:putative MATE family efflux protein
MVMSAPPVSRRELWKEIWKLAWPIAGSNFLLRGAVIVDTAMVGRLGAAALAGLGIAQIPIFLAMAVERGLGVGGQVLIAYHTGAKEPERRLKVARAVVALSLLIAISVAVLLWFVTPTLCRWMGASDAMLAHALSFLKVYYIVFVFSGLFFVFTAIFQGAGDSKTPLYVTVGVNAVHVLMSYLFIFGSHGCPKMGVAGAALSLGASEFLGTIVLATIATRRGLWSPGIKGLSWGATKAVYRIGGPTVLERLFVNGMQGFYTRMLTGFGTAAFAAHRIGIDMEAFAFLPAMGFGQAATTAVGQRLGAGDPDGARRAGWVTAQISVMFMGILGLSYYFFAEQWMRLFTSDPEVIAYGIRFCTIAAFIQIPLAFAIVIAGALRGAGETRWVMAMPIVGGWLVRLPLSYLLGYVMGFGVMGVWWTMFVDWTIRGSLISLKYRYMKFRLGEKVRIPAKPAPVVATREIGG